MRTLDFLPLVLIPALLTGCGLFSDDPADDPFDVVVRESVPVEFTIDDSALCPPGEDCSATPAPSPGPVDLPPIEIPVPIDIVELTGNQELREISSRLKSVEIESIDYEIAPNSLNIPTPEMEMHMAAFSATTKDAQSAFFLANLPSAAAMTEANANVEVGEDARAQSSDLFKQLKFTAIAFGDKNIEQGELFPPQGAAEYKVTFNLKFTANPTEL